MGGATSAVSVSLHVRAKPPPYTGYLREPLITAIRKGDAAEVKSLLERGADPNTTEFEFTSDPGYNAIHIARSIEVVRLLLEAGAKVDTRSGCGNTPLMSSAIGGDLGMARLLVEHGANVNAHDSVVMDEGGGGANTSLIKAARAGHIEVVRFLLEHGARAHEKNDVGQTALDIASSRGHAEVVRILKEAMEVSE